MVAITMPGSPKITLKPVDSIPPNQPFAPHSRISETPTTMGETANGRSTTDCRRPRPGKRPRTSASAVTMPNTTFNGTTIATMISDMLSAEMAAGC